MADTYLSNSGQKYIAFTNEEKDHIYKTGCDIAHYALNLEKDGKLPKGWNGLDFNALSIPLLCEGFESGGNYLDLQVGQIAKYNKALRKLFPKKNFEKIFELKVNRNKLLTNHQVWQRMEAMRCLKKKKNLKEQIQYRTDLFEN